MVSSWLLLALAAGNVAAFPWVADTAGVESSILRRAFELEQQEHAKRQAYGTAATCPYNSNHTGAAPYNPAYPYCGAKNGQPGNPTCPNNLVPAKGDTAHAYEAPGVHDIRGPCPGLNTAANHHFLSHDGITNFTELIDAQQNAYGVGYDLAVLLAVLGVGLDGDPVTTKLSIGCDATNRTSAAGNGPELGLDGHNKFEGDTSLTRNDYFLANGDNYLFNSTLFKMMVNTCKNNFGRNNIALYRYQRYQQSLNENGNFYFGPKSLLLYGAASFLYELFPSLGPAGTPSLEQESYFFIPQQFPPNWYTRVQPYTIPDVGSEIFAQYELYPVAFGGNTGRPNTFVGIGQLGPYFSSTSHYNGTAAGIQCLLYQIATENEPSSLQGIDNTPTANFQFAAKYLNPIYTAAGSPCPLNYNNA